MLPTVLGSLLSSLLLWSGPPPLPPDAAVPVAPAESSPDGPAEPEAVAGEAYGPEAESASEPPPQPEPTAAIAPVAPAESDLPTFEPSPEPERLRDGVPPGYMVVRAPRWRGTGLFVGSGGLLAAALIFQLTDGLACGNCAVGAIERSFLAGAMGLAAGGGVVRARADAYDDTALRRGPRETRRALIAGAVLTGTGAVLGLVNDGMWWRCIFNASGPYATEPPADEWDFGGFDCRYGLSRGLLDVASISTATGLGLLSWSLVYRRDARAYERARVIGLRPTMGRERVMLGVEGRF
ncbi:hypothetical protein [Paraliomyxa miuraensis]|uniref:hypothetical protein n=1 Tax=Paraliomyxa miuraensis TaxID=376150 RepID=UPI00225B016E|nr:hypothetical protein [Paraliomyxa miuraensis]MCX4245134.1 hypothetical protein [Paraliomyxa miuraensis]